MNAPGVWVCDWRACPPITCMGRYAPVPAVVVPELAAKGGPDGATAQGTGSGKRSVTAIGWSLRPGPGRRAAPADANGLKSLERAAGQVTVPTGQGLAGIPQTLCESGIPALFVNNGRGVAYLAQSRRA